MCDDDMDSLPPGVPLSEIPAGVPPPGIIPNLIDPPSLVAATLAVGTIIILLTTSFTVLRIISNSTGGHKLGLSDCKTFRFGSTTYFLTDLL